MEISVSKLVSWIVGVLSVGAIGVTGYFLYIVFFDGPQIEETPSVATINTNVFGTKIQKAAENLVNPDKKIMLTKKDILFTETTLYKSFTDLPASIPLSNTRGRPDPFVPYVAP